jgi:hypothetical protein
VSLDALGNRGFRMHSQYQIDYIKAVAGVGDINGDGLADVAVKSAGYIYGASAGSPSRVWIVYGGAGNRDVDLDNLAGGGYLKHFLGTP